MANEVSNALLVDALPYFDTGFDELQREAVSNRF
jgi:hypothetical protein